MMVAIPVTTAFVTARGIQAALRAQQPISDTALAWVHQQPQCTKCGGIVLQHKCMSCGKKWPGLSPSA
jgi:hypothetical protein